MWPSSSLVLHGAKFSSFSVQIFEFWYKFKYIERWTLKENLAQLLFHKWSCRHVSLLNALSGKEVHKLGRCYPLQLEVKRLTIVAVLIALFDQKWDVGRRGVYPMLVSIASRIRWKISYVGIRVVCITIRSVQRYTLLHFHHSEKWALWIFESKMCKMIVCVDKKFIHIFSNLPKWFYLISKIHC